MPPVLLAHLVASTLIATLDQGFRTAPDLQTAFSFQGVPLLFLSRHLHAVCQ